MNRLYIAAFVAVLVMLSSVSYAAYNVRQDISGMVRVQPSPEAEAHVGKAISSGGLFSVGDSVVLRMGQVARYERGLTIRPTEVIEDSRCPMNARCIQAGTVKVSLSLSTGMGASTKVIELGSSITTENSRITLESVEPGTMAGRSISEDQYRFGFRVEKHDPSTAAPAPLGKCFVGGCSSQLCTDAPDAVSTCEYRDVYACYQGATCERQSTGECGWTMTPALTQCLSEHP